METLELEKLKTYRRVEMTKYIVFGFIMFVALHILGDFLTRVYMLIASHLSQDYSTMIEHLKQIPKFNL